MSSLESTTKPPEESTWDKEQIQDALAHLETLQDKLDALRYTLPHLLQPFSNQHNNRQRMLIAVQKAAVETTTTFKDFRQEWTAEKTQHILTKSTQSLAENADITRANETSVWGWNRNGER